MHYTISEEAGDDISSIVRYIAKDNPSASRRVTKQIFATCDMLGENPYLGKNSQYLPRKDLYMTPVNKYNNYLIFYTILSNHVRIIRVMHGARDIRNIFSD